MRVAMTYDLKSDYSLGNKAIHYHDFSLLDEISYHKELLALAGHVPVPIGSVGNFVERLRNGKIDFDIVLNFAEGCYSRNREGIVPALCEAFKIPYTGTDAFGQSLTLHKHQTKIFMQSLGIPVAKGFLIDPSILSAEEIDCLISAHNLPYPQVIRPNREGTSMGLKLVRDHNELKQGIREIYNIYEQEILCDEYIKGREIAVPVFGTGNDAIALDIMEYLTNDNKEIELYTLELKPCGKHITVFADISQGTRKRLIETALLAHKSIGCKDLSRIDFRLSDETPFLMEITPLPSLERESTFVRCAQKHGIEFHVFFDRILTAAWERFQNTK